MEKEENDNNKTNEENFRKELKKKVDEVKKILNKKESDREER